MPLGGAAMLLSLDFFQFLRGVFLGVGFGSSCALLEPDVFGRKGLAGAGADEGTDAGGAKEAEAAALPREL